MKQFLTRVIRKIFTAGIDPNLWAQAATDRNQIFKQLARVPQHPVDKGTQILLTLRYQELLRSGAKLPTLKEVGFRSYSQNSEDGVLLYIFALIGVTNRKVVEICAGTGVECNAANLIINHQWRGLLFDGNESNIKIGRTFYSEHPDTFVQPPTLAHAWITRENVNELITDNGFHGGIDLLSFDMDGMDYWVLGAIECIRPRVIVLEHSSPWGAERSVTVPYKADFVAEFIEGAPEYCSASLPAWVKLLKKNGYRLVGLETLGINAFFVLNGLGEDALPEVTAASCFPKDAPSGKVQQLKREAYFKRQNAREYLDV